MSHPNIGLIWAIGGSAFRSRPPKRDSGGRTTPHAVVDMARRLPDRTRFGSWSDFLGLLVEDRAVAHGSSGDQGWWWSLAVTMLCARAGICKPGADGETLAVTEDAGILADAVEASRRLIVFRAATDLSIILASVLTLKIVSLGRERQAGLPHYLGDEAATGAIRDSST